MAFRIITRTFLPKTIKPTPFQNPNFSSIICSNSNDLSNLFKRYGFPPSDLHNFFTKNQFLLNSNVSNVETSLKILSSFRSSDNFVVSMVYNCPRVLELDFLRKWESGVSKLGFSEKSSFKLIQNVLEVSRKLELYPDDVLRCIECLKGFGFSSLKIASVLEEFPMVITMNEEQIGAKIEFLLGLGIHWSLVNSVIQIYPRILGFGVKNKLEPLISEFTDLGFKRNEITEEIIKNPKILQSEVGELSRCLRMLNNLKCCDKIMKKIFSVGALKASYKVKLRIDCLHKHGLLYRDAFIVLRKEPRVILYDLDEIDKKIDFLTNTLKLDIFRLVEVPQYLGVYFEKQIVPRYNVIEYLRSKGGIGNDLGLLSLVKFSRLKFYNLYVKPYPECEKIYTMFEDVKVIHRSREGLWKLFKPPKYPDSKEDLKNMRSFVEQLH